MIMYEHSKYTKQGDSFILIFFYIVYLISYLFYMHTPYLLHTSACKLCTSKTYDTKILHSLHKKTCVTFLQVKL